MLFHSKVIENAGQEVSNFFWFLSQEFSKLVVLVREYRKRVVQQKYNEMYILPSFIFGLPRNYSNRVNNISGSLNKVVLRSLQDFQVETKKIISIEMILVYQEKWEDHKEK